MVAVPEQPKWTKWHACVMPSHRLRNAKTQKFNHREKNTCNNIVHWVNVLCSSDSIRLYGYCACDSLENTTGSFVFPFSVVAMPIMLLCVFKNFSSFEWHPDTHTHKSRFTVYAFCIAKCDTFRCLFEYINCLHALCFLALCMSTQSFTLPTILLPLSMFSYAFFSQTNECVFFLPNGMGAALQSGIVILFADSAPSITLGE